MDHFTITIKTNNTETELNIHPQGSGNFKVIYMGALIGEVYPGSDGWQAITADELEPGGFPVYQYDETSGHEDLMLSDPVVQAIGSEITKHKNVFKA